MDLIWFIYQLNLQARERIGIMGRTGTGMINFTKFNEFLISRLGFDHSCYCHSFLAHCFNLNSFERFKQQEIWTTLDRANFREFAANKAKQA